MSFSFLLIEQDGSMSQSVRGLLHQRFSMADIDVLNSTSDHNIRAWQCYDFILIDCFKSIHWGVEQFKRIQQITSYPSCLLVSDLLDIEQQALESGAHGYFYYEGSWASLSAKIDTLIELRKYLVSYPFRLEGWCLLEVLHNGGNSMVYRAVDDSGHQAAIKRYKYDLTHLSESSKEAFLANLQKFSRVDTPRLVGIFDSGISNGAIYQIMELLELGSLSDNLSSHPHLPLSHALTWFFEIVHALHVVHEAGLVHRDLKTANVLLRDDGSLALNDYGAATNLLVESGFIAADEIYCTPYYVSPERALDEPSGIPSDIYSLGIIFYELLMGEKPYHGSTEMELMMQHVLAPIPLFPPEYENYQPLLNKMLAKDQRDRLQRAIDVGHYLST